MTPSVPELVDFFVRLEDDPQRRGFLNGSPFQIFQAATTAGLFERLEQDAFARQVGKAVQREMIGFEQTHAGVPVPGAIWSDSDFQMRSGYFVTIVGRQMVDLFRRQRADSPPVGAHGLRQSDTERRDCFICHAGEDKDVARPLAEALRRNGYEVWFDEYELKLGDSLRRRIDQGLANSRFGVVILSQRFFEKEWTQRELDGLTAREVVGGERLILPVWHEIDQKFLASVSPTLADRVGVPSVPLEVAVKKIGEAVDQRRQAQTGG